LLLPELPRMTLAPELPLPSIEASPVSVRFSTFEASV
jgi:hypothetical protein